MKYRFDYVIGIDPGTTVDDNAAVMVVDRKVANVFENIDPDGAADNMRGTATAFVIEWPVSQGRRVKMEYVLQCRAQATRLRDALYAAGCVVFIVPRREVADQLGFVGDAGLNRALKLRGYKTGKGTRLNSTHLRSALACALLNVNHPTNWKFIYDPERERREREERKAQAKQRAKDRAKLRRAANKTSVPKSTKDGKPNG